MVEGPVHLGLGGRASFVRDWELRHLAPVRIEVGPFEEFEVAPSPAVEQAGLVEVDRDPGQGWLWLVQKKRLSSRRALTVMARVRRLGEQEAEDRRLVLLCEGEV